MDLKNGANNEESVISSIAKSTEKSEKKAKNAKGLQMVHQNSAKPSSAQKIVARSPKNLKIMPRLKRLDSFPQTLMPINEKFRKRWHVEGIIGKGGYGEIYLAIDMKRAEEVAIKAEPKERKGRVARRMILEQHVLCLMQGNPHVPLIFASGHTETFNYIILQLVSINLGDIRRMSPTRRLSKSTVGRIAVQAIAALREVHKIGYIHRDVKPANMSFGATHANRNVLMLLDFGLVRRYKDSDGEWREPRARAGFRGTHRYVSVRMHERLEQTPSDDMTSLLYTAFELLEGELPWKTLGKAEDVLKMKEAMRHNYSEFFLGPAKDLLPFSKQISLLDPLKEVPYPVLQESLKSMYLPKKLSDLYDWEDNFKEIEKTTSTTTTQDH